MALQQKEPDSDGETVHQQETDVICTVEKEENSNNILVNTKKEHHIQSSSSNILDNSNNDIWSITTCNKEGMDIVLEEQHTINKNDAQLQIRTIPRLWNKLKSLIAKNETNVDPRNFSASKKRLIMIQMMFAAIVTPLATTIAFPALPTMQKDLQTSETAINAATTSIYVFFNASAPIIWASYSDVYGRRRIYLISILIATIGNVCCALSINIAMLIVFRIMSAIGGCSILTVGTGILSDIYGPGERGKAYSWFVSAPLVVPAIAPVVGGYLTEGLGWRSTFACIAIYSFCIWIVMLFALPESLRKIDTLNLPVATTKEIMVSEGKDAAVMTKTEDHVIEKKKRRHVNPLSAIKLVRHGNIILPALFSGFLYFTFYIINTNMTWIYTNQYGFSAGIVGLCYLPGAFGGITGSAIAGAVSDKLYAADIKKGLKAYPERRLNYLVFGTSVIVLILSIVAYGWCTHMNVHFAYGLVTLFFAFASLIVPSIILTVYLVECYPKYSASTAACNNLIRFCLGGVGALVASDLQTAMGNGPLLSMCAGFIFFSFGLIIWTKEGRTKWHSTQQRNRDLDDDNENI